MPGVLHQFLFLSVLHLSVFFVAAIVGGYPGTYESFHRGLMQVNFTTISHTEQSFTCLNFQLGK